MKAKTDRLFHIAAFLLLLLLALSCRVSSKLSRLRTSADLKTLSLAAPKDFVPARIDSIPSKDTIKVVDFEGKDMYLYSSIVDDDGQTVANQVLDAAVVVARFRNVAERHGRIDLEFQVIVPEVMHDRDWQIRYQPHLYIMQDSLDLDRILITGQQYRNRQLRGYQHYQRFIDSIITDSTRFIDLRSLEIFLRRNIPEIYALKTDSTFVDEEKLSGIFGVSHREAVEHYTDYLAIAHNEHRKSRSDKMFRKYVKAPILTEGIRLDTVLKSAAGNYVYNYVQTIKTRSGLRKADIVLDGEIHNLGGKLMDIPPSEPITFFISSVSAFVDDSERYVTKVIERKVSESASCNIAFAVGSSVVDRNLGANEEELQKIERQIRMLMRNDVFDLDSVTVVSSCSPEGAYKSNAALSRSRGENISAYFASRVKSYRDSVRREEGYRINLDDDYSPSDNVRDIRINSRTLAENWELLDYLVEVDSVLDEGQKQGYAALQEMKNPDDRERAMKDAQWYAYVKRELYPRLRASQFQFYLSRKGMQKDTVHTSVLDTAYMKAVQAIKDRDYESAADMLAPYADYNTAVAYLALDRNQSALAILRNCPRNAKVNYMLAIIYARGGDDQKAVQAYLDACAENSQYVHRGNLDPEISALIRKYNLNNNTM